MNHNDPQLSDTATALAAAVPLPCCRISSRQGRFVATHAMPMPNEALAIPSIGIRNDGLETAPD